MHYINEQIIDRQIHYISNVPWYKKITKKQRREITREVQKIYNDVFELSRSQIESVELEIKNHTRENFSLKLKNVTQEIKNEQKEKK